MIPQEVREMANPYVPMTTKLAPTDFIGREEEIAKLRLILEEYRKTSSLRNVVISGDRSIGKSCLLNRYKQVLEDYNFVVYEVELPRDPSIEIDDFEFFKSFFDDLFEKYAPPEYSFFDEIQSEIWFSLTRDKYDHSSDFKDRKIAFASQYANTKKGGIEKLSYKQLERDFERTLEQLISPKMEIEGLAILIDEFQELSRKVFILDLLRQISEKLMGLMIIGTGLPTFLDVPIFEKFCRGAESVNLGNMKRHEVIDLIIRPLERAGSFSRHEIQQWFDIRSIHEIVERGGGNPLHVKILSSKMFEWFQKNPSLQVMELNKSVMEKVNEFYSTISEKSRRISLSLQSCTRDQLEAFSLIYQYDGFSLRVATLLEIAFKPLEAKEEVSAKDRLIGAFEDIWGFNLFEFLDKDITLEDLRRLDINSLANVEYKFIGDPIDKLYASYYYEELTEKKLIDNNGKSFEDLLAFKLADNFDVFLVSRNIPKSKVSSKLALIRVKSTTGIGATGGTEVIEDFDRLIDLVGDDKKEISKNEIDKREAVIEISRKHELEFPAFLASSILEIEGYYVVLADVTIKGKQRLIYKFNPVTAKAGEIRKIREQIKDISIDNTSLDQYFIKVNLVYIYWLPKHPLVWITHEDIDEQQSELFEAVGRRDFESAVEIANRIKRLLVRISLLKGHVIHEVDSINNYGFCLININSFSEARKYLEKFQNRLLISRINFAYLLYLEDNYDESRRVLNRVIRKHLGKDEQAKFMHLAINHPQLPFSNRIIEDVHLYNVALWNLALINSQQQYQDARIYSFLKKVHCSKSEQLVDQRVRNWVEYFRGNLDAALKNGRELLTQCSSVEYLKNDISKDIKIFESDCQLH